MEASEAARKATVEAPATEAWGQSVVGGQMLTPRRSGVATWEKSGKGESNSRDAL